MTATRVLIDANVLLRFLRNDDPKQSPLAAKLFQRAQAKEVSLIASAITILEVFYVLSKTYRLPHTEAARILRTLLAMGIVFCEDGGVTLDALQRITKNTVSFGDAHLAALAARNQDVVASFDQDLRGFKDIQLYDLEREA